MKKFMVFMLFVLLLAPCAMSQEVREYTVNKVSGTAPVIDGEFTEEEWAGSVFTGEFFGLDHGDNAAEWAGKVIDEKWQWRALWDNDYLYVLITAELQYINMNGWVYSGDMVTPLEADDTGYAGWGAGQNLDFECFISPNWDDDMTGYPNEAGQNPPAYQMAYFPLLADEENGQLYADSNFGSRTTAEGPPFFHTGTMGAASIAGGWNPIYDASEADTADVQPFKLAALPHLVEGAVAGEGIFGVPVLEVAFPFSQFSFPALPDVEVIEDVDILLEELIMIPDENGAWVKPGDVWLFNICGYVDGAIHEAKALSYISWNQMGPGGFHNAPRGKMIFAAGTSVTEWMMH
jgi:hypothetical protein